MHIGFFNYYEIYNKNKMFTDVSAPMGDDLMYPFVYLFELAKTKNINISTIDTELLENYDAIVFMEFPTLKNKYFRQLINNKFENLYLMILESDVIRPGNWNVNNHKYFKKIFTWNDKLVDDKKYIKFYLPNQIPANLDFNINKKTELCTTIIGNKIAFHPLELYTERRKAIRWFEQNHPDDFDLYGRGWFRTKNPSYKGTVKSKREVLQKYKFAICYENTRDVSGYITEKIFDCFFAGCVPIYLGAPNITEHIPANTFIDRRKFNTYKELYSYLKNMSDKEYINYLDAIKSFVESEKIYPFSAEYFAETIIQTIIGKEPEYPFRNSNINRDDTKVIFDIGANIGSITLAAVRSFPNAHIYSFEPVYRTYQALCKNIRDYKERITAYNFGFLNVSKRLDIHITSSHGANSIISQSRDHKTVHPHIREIDTQNIEVCTMDSFVSNNNIDKIDIVKVDVEGVEKEVIEGGRETFKNKVDNVFIELSFLRRNRESTYWIEICKLLYDLGFILINIYDVARYIKNGRKYVSQMDAFFTKQKECIVYDK